MKTVRKRKSIMKVLKEPGGIWKLGVMCLFMDLAWRTRKEVWLVLTDMMMLEDHNGRILMRHFSSSTCSIVQRLHGLEAEPSGVRSRSGSLIMQALFRNLTTHHQQLSP